VLYTGIFLMALCLFIGCGSGEQQANKTQSPVTKAQSTPEVPSGDMQAFSPTKTDYSGYYIGKIDSKYPVQMELTLTGDSAAVAGSYYYEASARPLSLRGKLASKNLTITETNHDAVKTGSFNGRLTAPNRFEGTWKNSTGKKSSPFQLKRVAAYNAKVTSATKASARDILPTFLKSSKALSALNSQLAESAQQRSSEFIKNGEEFAMESKAGRAGWEITQNCKITYYSENLISLMTSVYEYSGGAHGNTAYATQTFDVSGSQPKQLGLAELFNGDSDYVSVLSNLVVEELRKQNAPEVVNGRITSFGEEDLQSFFLTSKSIKFAFEPYAVGPYAAGSYFAEVPYSKLTAIIGNGSPLTSTK